MTKVAVMSDTHGILYPQVLEIAKSCDRIIHAGDFDNERIAKQLDAIAPMYMVRGNNDYFIPYGQLETLRFSIEDVNFCVIHNRNYLTKVPSETDIVVFGHTHLYTAEKIKGVLWLNPGSAWKGRFRSASSMAVLNVDGADYSVEKILL